MSTSFASSRQFAGFAVIAGGMLTLVNALALILGIVRGRVGFATVGQVSWLVIFGTLAFVYFRRWRKLRTEAVARHNTER